MGIDPFRMVLPCAPPCPQRMLALINERFLPARTLGGWVWLDAPLRSQTWRARYFAATPDHSGEPYVFTACVFCGGTLPEPLDDDWGEGEE